MTLFTTRRKSLGFAIGLFWVGYLYLLLNPEFRTDWYIDGFDSADYVFLAEHFWKVPHTDSYSPDFSPEWRQFLTLFPFRQLGVGTFFLILRFFFGASTLLVGPYFLKALLAASYAWFAHLCARTKGWGWGTVSFFILLWTTFFPASGAHIYTEPFLRIFFVGIIGLTLFNKKEESPASRKMIWTLSLLGLLVVHTKAQWLLLAFVIAVYQGVVLIRERARERMLLLAPVAALIPLSLLAVNIAGWNYLGLAGAGYSFHAMNLGEGVESFLSSACAEKEIQSLSPRFCEKRVYRFASWADYLRFQHPSQDLKKLVVEMDRFALKRGDRSPSSYSKAVWEGYPVITHFPYLQKEGVSGIFFRWLDVGSIFLCLIGIFIAPLRFPSLICHTLWLGTLIARHLAFWDVRYLTPIAGLPIIVAIFVAARLKTITHFICMK